MKKLIGLLALTAAAVLSPAAQAQMPSCTPSNNCYVFSTSGNGTFQVTAIPPGTTTIQVQIVSTGVTVAGTAQIQTAATISSGALVSPVNCGSSGTVGTAGVITVSCSYSAAQPWSYVGVTTSGVTGTTAQDSLWFTSSLTGKLAALAASCESHTVSAAASVKFTSVMTGKAYTQYDIILNALTPSAAASPTIQVSSDGGTTWDTTAAHYSSTVGYANTTTAGQVSTTTMPGMSLDGLSPQAAAHNGALVFSTPATGSGQAAVSGVLSVSSNSFYESLLYTNAVTGNALQIVPCNSSGVCPTGTLTGTVTVCPKLL